MTVAVLGAGVVGVATAYYLARDGHAVTVVDRQPGPALEASFANGGQISANHATPWAGPATPWKALKWLGRTDAPLLLHLRADPALIAWLWRFLRNCTRARVRINIERALRVALYSRRKLAEIRGETGIHYDELSRGILHIFRDPAEYRAALAQVDLMNRLGCRRLVVDPDACVGIEPALAAARPRLIGGIFSPDDESGDAHAFTTRLAEVAASLGVRFRYGAAVRRLIASEGRITDIALTDGERLQPDAVVLALGSQTPLLLRPLGLRLPVYPAKGYSVTIPVGGGRDAPTVSLIDDEVKMVYSRLGDRLRAAGTAEFAGYDDTVDQRRAGFLLAKTMELFPDCGDPAEATFWAGLRPATPDGVPVLGPTPFGNLFLNTGHGTLGWTMACGAGRIVADLVAGRPPEVSLDGLDIDRFRRT
ncbi:MAG: D-amino acid dehydrogenase [Rhodospirillales bacterium]|nr:MAG: D-amino acid dehydrogenase [Rhodospirillales bacterium]